MIQSARRFAALLPCSARVVPSLQRLLAGRPTLHWTLARLARSRGIESIILLAPRGAPLPPLPSDQSLGKRLILHELHAPLEDHDHRRRLVARAWSPAAWRGGIGGATCHDELLFHAPLLAALEAHGLDAALLAGPDWPLVDPALADALVDRHMENADRLKLVFTQAPPGLAPCLVERSLLEDLARHRSMIGSVLDYQPRLPQGDPIAKDPCVQIEPAVRNAALRFTAAEPRWAAATEQALLRLGEGAIQADAASVVRAADGLAESVHAAGPQQVTVELTARRLIEGPIVPRFPAPPRDDLTIDAAREVFSRTAGADVALTLGHLGDPLLHPEFEPILAAAAQAGFAAIHVRTDLLIDPERCAGLMRLPIDVLSVNLSADTAETYRQLTGSERFASVIDHVQTLLRQRGRGEHQGWIVPRFVKTAANVHELETFFDRWVYYCGHAVIESPTTGAGATADLAVMNMAGPRRRPCRQLHHRLTFGSDGRATLCDQDWRGAVSLDPADAWRQVQSARRLHVAGQHERVSPCGQCREWHRP